MSYKTPQWGILYGFCLKAEFYINSCWSVIAFNNPPEIAAKLCLCGSSWPSAITILPELHEHSLYPSIVLAIAIWTPKPVQRCKHRRLCLVFSYIALFAYYLGNVTPNNIICYCLPVVTITFIIRHFYIICKFGSCKTQLI